MPQVDEVSQNHLEFENLLQRAKELTLAELASMENPATLSGADFELLVHTQILRAAAGTIFEGTDIEKTEDRVFPDVIVNGRFGVEVKATKKDDWTSIGNSVLESSRRSGLEQIYIFFGKLGGAPDIRYRDYEACLKGISVTHYPRYQIDMGLESGRSIFDLMGTSYDMIRSSDNPIKQIRDYYKSTLREGQTIWWIDDGSDKTPELSLVIQHFYSLDSEKKEALRAEAFVLFPEILSNSRTKFERVAAHWVSKYGIVSSSLRDNFSAGGQVEISIEGRYHVVPKIIKGFITLAPLISEVLAKRNERDLQAWKNKINEQSAHMELPLSASAIYEAALAGAVE